MYPIRASRFACRYSSFSGASFFRACFRSSLQMQLFCTSLPTTADGACIRNSKKVNPAAIVLPTCAVHRVASAIPLSLHAVPSPSPAAQSVCKMQKSQKRAWNRCATQKKRDGVYRPVLLRSYLYFFTTAFLRRSTRPAHTPPSVTSVAAQSRIPRSPVSGTSGFTSGSCGCWGALTTK